MFHHTMTHSLMAALLVGVFIGLPVRWRGANGGFWGFWGGGIYLSDVVLDLFVNDPTPPFGAQVFWPFSDAYFISAVTPVSTFDYFDPQVGILAKMLSLHDLGAILKGTI